MTAVSWLSPDELEELTGYVQRAKQQSALSEMRIPFRVNPRGRILVLREHVTGKAEKPRAEPDWSSLRKAS